jgi:23S rRNA (uridine2552-2'-O)-methyltransferase
MSRGRGQGKGQRAAKSGTRRMSQRVKTAKGRKVSSTLWLQRQLNDPYVAEARRLGYRSRAAFKLIELDDRFHFLAPGGRVVDLGAAPGGWTQVAVERTKAAQGSGQVVAIDIVEMDPVPGSIVLHHDFFDTDASLALKNTLAGPADVVLSDMAAPTTGHTATDHLRIIGLAEVALAFAAEVLAPGGTLVAKVLQGGTEHELLTEMKRRFAAVKHAKPPSSRSDSAELYVVAQGFRGVTE